MCLFNFLSGMRNWFKECFWRKKPGVDKEPYFRIDEI